MRWHTIFRKYCRYYSRHAIVVTTVVTTVIPENCMPTHVIFILMSDARCRAPFLRKNRLSWITTTAMTMAQRSAQHSPVQKSSEQSNNERAFSHVCRSRRVSRNVSGVHGVLSHHRNPSKLCVFWPRERTVTTIPG